MRLLLVLVISTLMITACSRTTQTTSGKSYLESYQVPVNSSVKSTAGVTIEDAILEAASVEPTLKFPARIGLARIDNRELTNVPGTEMEEWLSLAEQQGTDFGEFIPVNPMIAEMVSASFITQENKKGITNIINRIRLGAARQHLDAVIIYEVYSKTDRSSNVLSVADLTIIGSYILPSKSVKAVGYSNALLIDVVQGYPYGTADAIVEDNNHFVTSKNKNQKQKELGEAVKHQAVKKLVPEINLMFKELRNKLEN